MVTMNNIVRNEIKLRHIQKMFGNERSKRPRSIVNYPCPNYGIQGQNQKGKIKNGNF